MERYERVNRYASVGLGVLLGFALTSAYLVLSDETRSASPASAPTEVVERLEPVTVTRERYREMQEEQRELDALLARAPQKRSAC